MVTTVVAVTYTVLSENEAVFEPGTTVSVAGTDAIVGRLLESATTAPRGATPFNVTVPTAEFPLATFAGLKTREETENPDVFEGVTVTNTVFWVVPPRPSLTSTVLPITVAAATTGGFSTAVVPVPLIVPVSVVQP
jgi:hypothetical protein